MNCILMTVEADSSIGFLAILAQVACGRFP